MSREDTIPSSASPSTSNGYHHGDLRSAILETTLAIIAENGLESVTMRGIGHRLGVSEAAPYHHFENKAQLLSMLAADAYSSFHQALLRALDEAGADPFDRLLGFARAYVSYGLESRGRFRLMFGEQMLELRKYPHVLAAARPTRELLTEIAAACADETPFFEFTYWALGHGMVSLILEREIPIEPGSAEAEALTDYAISLLIAGISSRR